MARIRTIKPEFWRDELLSGLSAEAALLAIGLLNHSDDEGYFNANPKLIQSDIFPLRELSGSVTVMLSELARIGYIRIFEASDSKRYGLIVNFSKHQVINKKIPSKVRDLCLQEIDYGMTTVVVPSGKERKGKEHGKEGNGVVAVAPRSRGSRIPLDLVLPDQWREYCQKERYDLNPDKVFENFKDYWLAKAGKDGCKSDWDATWRSWVRKEKGSSIDKPRNAGDRNREVMSGLTRGLIGGNNDVGLLGK